MCHEELKHEKNDYKCLAVYDNKFYWRGRNKNARTAMTAVSRTKIASVEKGFNKEQHIVFDESPVKDQHAGHFYRFS